jgi:hypothetical protein
MDLLTAASLASYQYQQATQAGGPAAGVAQALGSAQTRAAQTAALLPSTSGPAALLELSPQALQASANDTLAVKAGQGQADVQALLQQATASSGSATAALVGNGDGFSDPTTASLLASYQYLQAQQAGSANTYRQGLVSGGSGPATLLNTLG